MGTASAFVWTLARFAVWLFYRVERVGRALPAGPVLLVANHPNALLDPAVIVATAGRTPRFLAKSTLFTMPLVGWFVRGAGAIPVYRRTDAGVDTARNAEMFAAVERALAAGDLVCLFPEGTTHSRGRLDPLKTGAARIALGAAARGVDVQVIAVGLNLDRKAVLRSDATVAYGPPFGCGHLLDLHATDPVAAVTRFTGEIAEHLRDLVVEAEPVEEAALIAKVDRIYVAARGVEDDADRRLARRQWAAEHLLPWMREHRPEQLGALVGTASRYERSLQRFGLSDEMVGGDVPPRAAARFAVRESLWLALLGPVVAIGFAAFFVPYQLIKLLTSRVLRVGLEEQATYKVLGAMIFYTLWVIALGVAAGRALSAPIGWSVAAALPPLAVATLLAWEREAAVFDTVRSYLAWQLMSPAAARTLVAHRQAIAEALERLAEGAGSAPVTDREPRD
jgi:1-acyl-sn-glycerol-3-phosphate acyltransferase